MVFKEGQFIEVEYVGIVKETGDIFDLTDEKLAREKGIFSQNSRYGPVTIILGEHQILKGLEDKLKDLSVGDKKTIELLPDKAFGLRSPGLMKLMSMKKFRKEGVTPVVGQFIDFGQAKGRVVSVSGGRVSVDFNHPLAGKSLEYEIKINRELKSPEEKIKAVVDFYSSLGDKVDVKLDKSEVSIMIPSGSQLTPDAKKGIADLVLRHIPETKSVTYLERYDKSSKSNES